jgi:hypothetical protein
MLGFGSISLLACAVALSHATFVAIGRNAPTVSSTTIISSRDGVTWTSRSTLFPQSGNAVAYSARLNLWLAVGGNAFANNSDAIATSADGGVTWIGRGNLGGMLASGHGVTWGQNQFVILSDNKIVTSPDGATFTVRASPFTGSGNAAAFSAAQNRWVAGGRGGVATSQDAVTWTLAPPWTARDRQRRRVWRRPLGGVRRGSCGVK